MRVVQLDGDLVRQRLERVPVSAVAPQDVLERARDQEVLLPEPELAARVDAVVRVEDLGQVLGLHLLVHGRRVVALAEVLEVELPVGARGPEPQRVHVGAAPADDRHVVGHPDDRPRVHPAEPERARVGRGRAAALEGDAEHVLGARQLPGMGQPEPVVGLLDLGAVPDALTEQTVLVPEPVAHGRVAERRERVEEARGQPAEPAVAEPRVGLQLAEVGPVAAERAARVAARRVQAEVDRVVEQVAPGQELHRQVVDALDVLAVIGLLRDDPALEDPVAHGVSERKEAVVGRRAVVVLGERVAEVAARVPREGRRGAATHVTGGSESRKPSRTRLNASG